MSMAITCLKCGGVLSSPGKCPICDPAAGLNEAPDTTSAAPKTIYLDAIRRTKEPHSAGPAFCACGHKWTAVARIGTVHLECPECRRMLGLFEGECLPKLVWQCACGNSLFYIDENRKSVCRVCGATPT